MCVLECPAKAAIDLYMNSFRRILGDPLARGDVVDDWRSTEGALGVSLPVDYKEFVSAFGLCEVGGVLDFFHPQAPPGEFSRSPLVQMGLLGSVYAHRRSKRASSVPYLLISEGGGLLPAAVFRGGAYLHIARGLSGDVEWGVVIDDRHGWREYRLSFSDFLIRALEGRLDPPLFTSEVIAAPTYRLQ
ncbi:SMI1/KNR4 family protein [Streptomyces sp. I6]|uniref:SMI1/KNR4 family protein n=1 Tax=Streptomyces sp. I6 TaxID=2483113 RepID=UPI000F44F46B|nr:SMI1/KNR4 family protein [Streptomyces sp. I6]RNL73187.1 SMI1/KNR4 family protein [Streptomyces sp. I6]